MTLSNQSGIVDATIGSPLSELAVEANTFPMAMIGMLLFAILIASSMLWWKFIIAYIKGIAFFPTFQPRQIQRWGVIDLAMAVASVFVLSALAFGLISRIGVPRVDLMSGTAASVVKVAIATFQLSSVAVMTILIAIRYRMTISNIGWSTERLVQDIRLGLVTFVMILPPIYILMALSTLMFKQPYNHPVVDAIKNDPSTLPMAIWLAVVIAPILEEFGFRVLLQGFLESIARGPLSLKMVIFGRRETTLYPHDSDLQGASPEQATDIKIFHNNSEMIVDSKQLPWWPVIVSGVLFGLAHFDYGASWLPLAVLGIVLGYLYRITNRIWPGLVVHACLNGMTMLNLTIITLYGDPSKIQ